MYDDDQDWCYKNADLDEWITYGIAASAMLSIADSSVPRLILDIIKSNYLKNPSSPHPIPQLF